jgi:hypothetical protein
MRQNQIDISELVWDEQTDGSHQYARIMTKSH